MPRARTASRQGTPGPGDGRQPDPFLRSVKLLRDEVPSEHYAGSGEFIRYANHVVFVFRDEQTARSIQAALMARLTEGGLALKLDKSGIIPFVAKAPRGRAALWRFDFYWGRNRVGERTLKVKTSSKRLNRCMKAFTDWIKEYRNRKPLKTLWLDAAAKLRGHFDYFGVLFNQGKLSPFYRTSLQSLFKWLNRRSQKRSFTREKFERKLWFNPLLQPPRHDAPKSRMGEIRQSVSVRGLSRQWRLRPT